MLRVFFQRGKQFSKKYKAKRARGGREDQHRGKSSRSRQTMEPLLHQHMVPQHSSCISHWPTESRGVGAGGFPTGPTRLLCNRVATADPLASGQLWVRLAHPLDPDWQQLSGRLGTKGASLSSPRTWNWGDLLLAKHHSTIREGCRYLLPGEAPSPDAASVSKRREEPH